MKASLKLLPLLLLTHFALARAEDRKPAVKALYSPDFQVRAKAVKDLSAARPGAEAGEVASLLKKELECAGAPAKPAGCHAHRFVYNALMAAGNLAEKDSGEPWALLVWLSRGETVNEGSFFQDPAKPEDDGHRGAHYFSPANPDPKLTRKALQKILDRAVAKAGVVPSCSWSREKIAALARPAKAPPGYEAYSYFRDYSPAGVQGQFRVTDAQDWVFKDGRQVSCGRNRKVVQLGAAGFFAAAFTDYSDETTRLLIELYALESGKLACAYEIEGLPEGKPDPVAGVQADPAGFLPALFEIGKDGCKPRKVPGYTFTPAGGAD